MVARNRILSPRANMSTALGPTAHNNRNKINRFISGGGAPKIYRRTSSSASSFMTIIFTTGSITLLGLVTLYYAHHHVLLELDNDGNAHPLGVNSGISAPPSSRAASIVAKNEYNVQESFPISPEHDHRNRVDPVQETDEDKSSHERQLDIPEVSTTSQQQQRTPRISAEVAASSSVHNDSQHSLPYRFPRVVEVIISNSEASLSDNSDERLRKSKNTPTAAKKRGTVVATASFQSVILPTAHIIPPPASEDGNNVKKLPFGEEASTKGDTGRNSDTTLKEGLSDSQDRPEHSHYRYRNQCEYMVDWQARSFPACNSMHEMSMINDRSRNYAGKKLTHRNNNNNNVRLLSMSGKIRSAWTWNAATFDSAMTVPIVWKVLHLDRDFDARTLEFHRVDATVMERLSSSPHVTNIYGYCGQSVWTEFGDDSIASEMTDAPTEFRKRYGLAIQLAHALEALQSIDAPNSTRPTVAYFDLKPMNLLFSVPDKNGQALQRRLMLSDFNLARLLKWDPVENKPCGFPIRSVWEIVPEVSWKNHTDHTYLDAASVDNFRLGQLIYNLGTRDVHGIISRSMEYVYEYLDWENEQTKAKEYDWYQAALLLAACAGTQAQPADRPSAFEMHAALRQAQQVIERYHNQSTSESDTITKTKLRVSDLRSIFEIRAPIPDKISES